MKLANNRKEPEVLKRHRDLARRVLDRLDEIEEAEKRFPTRMSREELVSELAEVLAIGI